MHTAKGVTNWIGEKKIKILPDWPSQSPDLNLVELLWNELEMRLENRKKHQKRHGVGDCSERRMVTYSS